MCMDDVPFFFDRSEPDTGTGIRDTLFLRRCQRIFMIDGDAQAHGFPQPVVQFHGQFSAAGSRGRQHTQRPGIPGTGRSHCLCDTDAILHARRGKTIEHGQDTGIPEDGRPVVISGCIGTQQIVSRGKGGRELEHSGTPAAHQGDLGLDSRSVGGKQFEIGDAAAGLRAAQAEGGAPDQVTGDISRTVGRNVNPFAGRAGQAEAQQQAEQDDMILFHTLILPI